MTTLLQAPTDPVNASRGIVNSVITSAPFWVALAVVVLYWLFQS